VSAPAQARAPAPTRIAAVPDTELHRARLSLPEYTRRVLVAVGIVAVAIALWKLAALVVVAFAGVVAAVLVRSLASPLADATGLGSRAAVALVTIALLGLLALALWIAGDTLFGQVTDLWSALPGALAGVRQWLEQRAPGRALLDSLASIDGLQSARRVAGVAVSTIGAVGNLVIVAFLGIYLALDPALYRRGVLHLVPTAARAHVAHALDSAGEGLRRWLLGQLVAMVCVGALTGVAMWLLGVPFALSLGVIAGLLEFVPFLGPIVAMVPGVLLAFTVSPATALYAALAYLAIQQVEGNLLMPIVQRWAVALPPALGILAVVVFGLLFGLPGVMLAVPLMVVAMILVQELYVGAALGEREAVEPR
jgi:predicted PurR-regulated permease PerM